MARRDPYAAVDAFFAAIARYPEFQPYFVEAMAECESEQAGYEGNEELERSLFLGERACYAAVRGHGRVSAWRSRVEAALADGGYTPISRDSKSFQYLRYLNDAAAQLEELDHLATLGDRGDTLPWPSREPTEMATVDPSVESYWEIVQRVRQSSFRPTQWRCAASWKSSVVGIGGQTYWVVTAPLHDGWHEPSSVFVQVFTDDAVAVPSVLHGAVRRALAARRYRPLQGPPTARGAVLQSLRHSTSASGAVREAVRVHEQLMALCAAH